MKKNNLAYVLVCLSIILLACNNNEDEYEKQVKEDDQKLRAYMYTRSSLFIEDDLGFFYEKIIENTSGEVIKKDDVVNFYYRIKLLDETLVDDYMDEKNTPLLFKKGNAAIWPSGLEKAIELMHVGEHYRFYLPSYLAYFSYGHSGFFPSFSNLIIDIKIQGVDTESELNLSQIDSIESFIETQGFDNVLNFKSGLYYIKKREGSGVHPTESSYVELKWTRKYLDGTIIRSTGTSSYNYYLSGSNIVDGLKEGIKLMQKGESAIFIMPSDLAFGNSLQVIPHDLRSELFEENMINYDVEPYSPVLYEIELVNIY